MVTTIRRDGRPVYRPRWFLILIAVCIGILLAYVIGAAFGCKHIGHVVEAVTAEDMPDPAPEPPLPPVEVPEAPQEPPESPQEPPTEPETPPDASPACNPVTPVMAGTYSWPGPGMAWSADPFTVRMPERLAVPDVVYIEEMTPARVQHAPFAANWSAEECRCHIAWLQPLDVMVPGPWPGYLVCQWGEGVELRWGPIRR